LYFFPLPHQQTSFRPVSAFSVSETLLPLNKRSSSFTMLQTFLPIPRMKNFNKKAASHFQALRPLDSGESSIQVLD
jgi:hypothetical protein